MQQQRCMFSETAELYPHVNDMSDFVATVDNSFQILKEIFLIFLVVFMMSWLQTWYTFSLNCIINIASVA